MRDKDREARLFCEFWGNAPVHAMPTPYFLRSVISLGHIGRPSPSKDAIYTFSMPLGGIVSTAVALSAMDRMPLAFPDLVYAHNTTRVRKCQAFSKNPNAGYQCQTKFV